MRLNGRRRRRRRPRAPALPPASGLWAGAAARDASAAGGRADTMPSTCAPGAIVPRTAGSARAWSEAVLHRAYSASAPAPFPCAAGPAPAWQDSRPAPSISAAIPAMSRCRAAIWTLGAPSPAHVHAAARPQLLPPRKRAQSAPGPAKYGRQTDLSGTGGGANGPPARPLGGAEGAVAGVPCARRHKGADVRAGRPGAPEKQKGRRRAPMTPFQGCGFGPRASA